MPVSSSPPRVLISLLVLVALLVVQQGVSLPADFRLGRALNNSAHVFWFALCSLLLWNLMPRLDKSRMAGIGVWLLVCLVLGVILELFQIFTDRSASLLDALRNAMGVLLALCLLVIGGYTPWRSGQARGMALAGSLLVVVLGLAEVLALTWLHYQRQQIAPALVEVEPGGVMLRRLSGNWALQNQGGCEGGDCRFSLRVHLDEGRRWPGVTLHEPLPDWRPYSKLQFDIAYPGVKPLQLHVRVVAEHDNGLNYIQYLELNEGLNRVSLALDLFPHVARGDRVKRLLIYTPPEFAGAEFELLDLQLADGE